MYIGNKKFTIYSLVLMALRLRRTFQWDNQFYGIETTVYQIQVSRNELDQDELNQLQQTRGLDCLPLLGSLLSGLIFELNEFVRQFDPQDSI